MSAEIAMSDDLEQIARIIDPGAFNDEASPDSYHARHIFPAMRQEALEKARAVIALLMEPSPAAREAGSRVISGRFGHSFEPDPIWQAMLSTILNEKGKE